MQACVKHKNDQILHYILHFGRNRILLIDIKGPVLWQLTKSKIVLRLYQNFSKTTKPVFEKESKIVSLL